MFEHHAIQAGNLSTVAEPLLPHLRDSSNTMAVCAQVGSCPAMLRLYAHFCRLFNAHSSKYEYGFRPSGPLKTSGHAARAHAAACPRAAVRSPRPVQRRGARRAQQPRARAAGSSRAPHRAGPPRSASEEYSIWPDSQGLKTSGRAPGSAPAPHPRCRGFERPGLGNDF
jgi:hypothetical protein